MLSSLQNLKTILLTVSNNFGHYEALDTLQPYGVWAEDIEASELGADDYKAGQTIQGTIDWYTKDQDDPVLETLPAALNAARIRWKLNSVQYEDETGYIHYEWLFYVRQYYSGEPLPEAEPEPEDEDGDDQIQGD